MGDLDPTYDPAAFAPADGGETSSSADAAWWQKPLQLALNKYIDAEFAGPMTFNDPSGYSYAVAQDGRLYVRGQPVSTAQAQTASMLSNPVVVLAGLAALGLLAYAIVK